MGKTLGIGGEQVGEEETVGPSEDEGLGNKTEKKRTKTPTKLNFGVMAEEFGPDKLWNNRTSAEIWTTFGINLCVGLLPTLFDLSMDSLAVNDYITGTYYVKAPMANETGLVNATGNCRLNSQNATECFEKDPIFGYVTLTCFFFPGFGFSFWTFLSLSNFLRGTDYTFRQNLCFFLFFTPLAFLSAVTFPFQLLIVNIVALINGGTQWTTLTAKYSIAEGLYDASIQFCVQLFIIFTMGDRLPSTIQYLSLTGSILMLSVPRIEAFLLDQGGVTLPIKEKLLKTLEYFPLFFFNSIFKLGSIGLICAILRYNAITFYAILFLVWLLVYLLFNEKCLPQSHYHLILGVAVHVVSIGKITNRVKIIDTKLRPKQHHNVTTKKLTSKHQKQNIIFQNVLWLFVNSVVLILLVILTSFRSELWTLWPVIDGRTGRHDLSKMPITRHLNAIVPAILVSGVISLGLILLQLGCGRDEEEEEEEEEDEECGDEGCADDPSVQGKVAKKLEPMLNVVASATDVEL